MVEVLCRHVFDESSTVQRLCLQGLVQVLRFIIPLLHILKYTTQVLGVILALLDDSNESVQLTVVSCLLMILDSSPDDVVEPILLNLSIRLRNLQVFGMLVGKMGRSPDAIVRATSSAALGLLLKSSNLYSLRAVQLDRLDSTRNHDAESTKN